MLSVLKYLMLALIGAALFYLIMLANGTLTIPEHKLYFSLAFKSSYGYISASVLFLTGVAVGYFSRLSPWLTGLSLTLIFPVTAVYEYVKYPESRSLKYQNPDVGIFMDLLMYFFFSFPAIMGVFIGRLI